MTAEPILRVRNLEAFHGDVQALWDVSFEAFPGELVVLLGANGGGKTTTIRAISGMLRPAGGSVEFRGAPITGLSSRRIVERGIGHVPEGRALFPMMSVRENLLMGAYLPGLHRRRRKNLEKVFSLFPVLKVRHRQMTGTLSGGEQQMCAIGRGLMSEPSLLMLDEPSLGLAPLLVEEIFQIISDIRKEGVTVLLVEQHVERALEVADRGYILADGRTVGNGTGTELLANPEVRKAYLSV
ncbi:MAG: ABC transporter ATP-binding protein [Candidatus Deferrimicrobium sp.]